MTSSTLSLQLESMLLRLPDEANDADYRKMLADLLYDAGDPLGVLLQCLENGADLPADFLLSRLAATYDWGLGDPVYGDNGEFRAWGAYVFLGRPLVDPRPPTSTHNAGRASDVVGSMRYNSQAARTICPRLSEDDFPDRPVYEAYRALLLLYSLHRIWQRAARDVFHVAVSFPGPGGDSRALLHVPGQTTADGDNNPRIVFDASRPARRPAGGGADVVVGLELQPRKKHQPLPLAATHPETLYLLGQAFLPRPGYVFLNAAAHADRVAAPQSMGQGRGGRVSHAVDGVCWAEFGWPGSEDVWAPCYRAVGPTPETWRLLGGLFCWSRPAALRRSLHVLDVLLKVRRLNATLPYTEEELPWPG